MSDADNRGTPADRDQQDVEDTIYGLSAGYDGCPCCGRDFNAVLGPNNSIESPDEGEWCFHGGRLFIHEKLVWEDAEAM